VHVDDSGVSVYSRPGRGARRGARRRQRSRRQLLSACAWAPQCGRPTVEPVTRRVSRVAPERRRKGLRPKNPPSFMTRRVSEATRPLSGARLSSRVLDAVMPSRVLFEELRRDGLASLRVCARLRSCSADRATEKSEDTNGSQCDHSFHFRLLVKRQPCSYPRRLREELRDRARSAVAHDSSSSTASARLRTLVQSGDNRQDPRFGTA
jgi:hypothetical protein